MAKAIIESAINDVALTKSLNPHVAYDSMEIADDAIATRKAGAALVHFHVRDAETGKSVFEHNTKCTDACRRTRAQCDVLPWPSADIMSMTRGERASMPDLLFCDPGSLNLVRYDLAKKKTRNGSAVCRNTYEDTRRTLTKLQELQLRPTINIFGESVELHTLRNAPLSP